ncbi:MAG TPA: hypothetical protein VMY34_03700 [Acidimicrobiales bacterium]|nr:hypothetical protein [Acidimicrobiales bacterium]
MTELRWWTGVPPVERHVPKALAGRIHFLEWSEGELHLSQHDEETLVLAALSAEQSCWCVALALAWRRVSQEPEVLAFAPREDEDALDQSLGTTVREAIGRTASMSSPSERLALGMLLALGPAMTHRLQATAIARTLAQWDDVGFRTEHEARMFAALYGRAKPAIARSISAAGLPPLRRLVLELGDDGLRKDVADDGTVVRASLPLTWLRDVWGRRVANDAAGRFVTAVTGVDADYALILEAHEWRR